MKRTRLLFGLCCLLAICSLPLKAQDNRNMYLRWGIMAGLNGYNAHTLNLSDDRGRYGFNLAARAELSFTDAPSRMYLDAELGLLKLGWKDGQAGYAIDALRFPGHGTMAPSPIPIPTGMSIPSTCPSTSATVGQSPGDLPFMPTPDHTFHSDSPAS